MIPSLRLQFAADANLSFLRMTPYTGMQVVCNSSDDRCEL